MRIKANIRTAARGWLAAGVTHPGVLLSRANGRYRLLNRAGALVQSTDDDRDSQQWRLSTAP